ncbi:MAG: 50S ribosomal protein L3 [Chloroflexi bacterium]|jgi:large subunit ribosomal protein L3|nr:50S ribosomal protein L3 [Chloroflexota bacterium]MBI5081540.1 50S ribosomal protein L3 [Chloroflexota bacterium]MBI5349859.1 50S ribosomal protein L3 [Chloroflexota bacterium]
MKGLLGKKVGMTQIFNESGDVIPVTVLEAGPCYVTQVRTLENDGYSAVQIGFEEVKPARLAAGEKGHLKRNNLPTLKHIKEFRVKGEHNLAEGNKLMADVFKEGEHVDVVGITKGKGFQGGIKRHHFSRSKKTHGQSDRMRSPGSNSSGTTPGRVYKGSRRPGHMGSVKATVQNVKVVMVDAERNLIAVNGSVPGGKGSIVVIQEARKQ